MTNIIGVIHINRAPSSGYYSIERLYSDIRSQLPNDLVVQVATLKFPSKGILRRIWDAVRISRLRADVFHVTGDVHYATYFLRRNRSILTIHDCVLLSRRTGVRRWVIWFLWYWLPVRRAGRIICVSETAKNELLSQVKFDAARVTVIPNCVSDEFRQMPKPFNAIRPRILQVGTSENKNIPRVLDALVGISCVFVIIGKLDEKLREKIKLSGVEVDCRSNLSREDLIQEYQLADIVMFASTYEGFGLPILEANAVGRAVVTSAISSMPEVAGDAACMVDPYDVESIRAGLRRVISDAPYRTALVKRGLANANKYSAEATAEKYAALYRLVAKSTRK